MYIKDSICSLCKRDILILARKLQLDELRVSHFIRHGVTEYVFSKKLMEKKARQKYKLRETIWGTARQ